MQAENLFRVRAATVPALGPGPYSSPACLLIVNPRTGSTTGRSKGSGSLVSSMTKLDRVISSVLRTEMRYGLVLGMSNWMRSLGFLDAEPRGSGPDSWVASGRLGQPFLTPLRCSYRPGSPLSHGGGGRSKPAASARVDGPKRARSARRISSVMGGGRKRWSRARPRGIRRRRA